MNKPITLYGLRFSDKKGNIVVEEEHFITFNTVESLELFIQYRYAFWKETLKCDLLILPDSQETLKEIEVMAILKLVAQFMGVPLKLVLSKTNKPDPVEVRRHTMVICIERKMLITTIARALRMQHDLVIYHRDKFKDLCQVDKKYKERYEEIENYVFASLFGKFK